MSAGLDDNTSDNLVGCVRIVRRVAGNCTVAQPLETWFNLILSIVVIKDKGFLPRADKLKDRQIGELADLGFTTRDSL